MKCPKLASYVKNTATNETLDTQIVGNYRGSALDKEMYQRRKPSTQVEKAGKKQ
jgi:hypothetical protein